MKKLFDVTVSYTMSATVFINAETQEAAELKAIELLDNGTLGDDCVDFDDTDDCKAVAYDTIDNHGIGDNYGLDYGNMLRYSKVYEA